MILHETKNKQIVEEFVQNLVTLQLQDQINWKRINDIQLKTENNHGEFNFYVHKNFTIKGWKITPGYFEIVTGGIKLNLYLPEYPTLKDLADKLIEVYFCDLQGDNIS